MSGDVFRPVTPELLGRDRIELDTSEFARACADRVVMVTEAGGSIGPELCRQLLDCQPSHIILFEQGEFTLYPIDCDLRDRANELGIPITIHLGSITNKARIASVIEEEGSTSPRTPQPISRCPWSRTMRLKRPTTMYWAPKLSPNVRKPQGSSG